MPGSTLSREQWLHKTEHGLKQSPLSKQGYLLLQKPSSKKLSEKKFSKYYYVLQGTELLCFDKKSATKAKFIDQVRVLDCYD
jgi:hypothetical protein|tara:strand:- start:170 stop:415 length:246 start_codon:yes stop_codon:yes gene_type:complete